MNKQIRSRFILLGFAIIVLAVALIFLSQVAEENVEEGNGIEKADPLIEEENDGSVAEIEFTEEEKAYIQKMKEKGVIKIATRDSILIYELDAQGNPQGFHYRIMKMFADYIGVEADFRVIDFSEYFMLDGKVPETVKTDPELSYSPDLFKEVDVYMDAITEMPWRAKLMRFIHIIPTRQVIITRTGEEITELEDIIGRKISLVKHTSQEDKFKEIGAGLGVEFEYYYVDEIIDMSKAVSEGLADVSAHDSDRAILEIGEFGNLSISRIISDMEHLSWAVERDNEVLASILEKYIDYLKGTEVFNKTWYEEYKVDLLDYLKLLDAD